MVVLPRIYKTEKTIIKGLVYVEFSCGCIFLDKEDRKRTKRSIFEKRNGKKTSRIFCPNHKNNSYIKHRFKICPGCDTKIIVTNNTVEGLCSPCLKFHKAEKKQKAKVPKPKDCLQHGEPYALRKNEKIVSEPMCKNRPYCISFIKKASTLIQCDKCPYAKIDMFKE